MDTLIATKTHPTGREPSMETRKAPRFHRAKSMPKPIPQPPSHAAEMTMAPTSLRGAVPKFPEK